MFLMFLIVFGVSLVNAVPFGTLGNINVPDGYVLPEGKIVVNFASYLRDGAVDFNDPNAEYEYNYVFNAKIGLFDKSELGLVYTGDEIFYANFKYKLVEESIEYPGVSFGVDNLFSKVGKDATDQEDEDYEDWEDVQDAHTYEKNSFYVTASKSFAFKGVPIFDELQAYITVGLGLNRFVGQRDLAQDFNGLFGTVELKPTEFFSMFAEQDGHAINVGAKYSWSNFDFQYSLLEIEEFAKENQENLKMALNIQYSITRWAKEKSSKSNRLSSRKDKVRKETQSFDQGGGGSSILDQIRALRSEEREKQSELNDLINELDELEE